MRRSTSCLFVLLAAVLATGCGPTYPKCDSDKDCKEKNEYCVNGMCQQCRDAKDCKPGEVCNKGRCEPGKKGCASDSDCPADQSCIDGACKPCASDSECGEGGKCKNGRCQRATSKIPDQVEPPPSACKLEPVFFDFNESVLTTEANAAIERNADCLKKVSGRNVTLTGHTDPRGTEEYNLALSDKRSNSVKERLQRVGVDGGRLKVVAKGELEATGTDESGWARDRRVEFSW